MILLPHSDTLTFPTDTEPQTAPSDTKSGSRSDKSQNMMSSAADSTNLRQDRADFHSDRSQPTTQEGKASRHGASNEQEGTRSQTSSQEQTPHQDLETHTPQDGAPSISAEQRQSSSEDKQRSRDGTSRSQAPPPPPSEIRNSRKESSVMKKQGNPPSGTVAASQSTVPQSQDEGEPRETRHGHSTSARDFDDDGHQTQDRTGTERGRGAEWDRDDGGGREKDRDESAAAGSRDEPSNTKNDATSHRL